MLLETEWKKRPVLPIARSSPPPSSPQKVNPPVADLEAKPESGPPSLPSQQTATDSAPVQTSAVPRPPSEMDVDATGMSPKSEGLGIGDDLSVDTRNTEGDEIVQQLEKGLPKLPGFGDQGWMTQCSPVSCLSIVMLARALICSHLIRDDTKRLCTVSRRTRISCASPPG